MDNKHFTKEDVNKVVDFLNMVASKAQFNMDTQEVIKYFGLLSHMQKSILPKLNDHILEISKLVENKESGE